MPRTKQGAKTNCNVSGTKMNTLQQLILYFYKLSNNPSKYSLYEMTIDVGKNKKMLRNTLPCKNPKLPIYLNIHQDDLDQHFKGSKYSALLIYQHIRVQNFYVNIKMPLLI